MKEATLRDFFLGKATADVLAREANEAIEITGSTSHLVHIEDLGESFQMTSEMALRLCDAVLDGSLEPKHLETIASTLIASDWIEWHDEDAVLANVLFDWDCPEINYPLTEDNVRRFRRWLAREEPYPSRKPWKELTREEHLIRRAQKMAKKKKR